MGAPHLCDRFGVVLVGFAVGRSDSRPLGRLKQTPYCGPDNLGSRRSLTEGHLVEGGDSLIVETDVDLGGRTIMLAA